MHGVLRDNVHLHFFSARSLNVKLNGNERYAHNHFFFILFNLHYIVFVCFYFFF